MEDQMPFSVRMPRATHIIGSDSIICTTCAFNVKLNKVDEIYNFWL